MNPEAIQKIIDALEKNGGQALEHLAAYKASEAYSDLALTVVATFVLFVSVVACCKLLKAHDEAPRGWGKQLPSVILSSITGVALFASALVVLAGLVTLSSNIATIKNPKGAAIQSLLNKY